MRRFLAALGLLLLPLGISAAPNPAYNPRYVAQVASTSYLPTLLVVPSAVQGGGGGSFSGGSITSNLEIADTIDILLASSSEIIWSSTTDPTGTADLGLKRVGAGILGITDGSTGTGSLQVGGTTASDNSTQAFNVTTTLPAAPSASTDGALMTITGAGSSSTPQEQNALNVTFAAGYTGNRATNAIIGTNTTNSTGTGSYPARGVYGVASAASWSIGVQGTANNTAAGEQNIGVLGNANVTTGYSIGVYGIARATSDLTQIGGFFTFGTGPISPDVAAALVADNSSETDAIIIASDNGTPVFTIADGGDIQVSRTVTAGGTTGNQTINKAAGTVNFAAAASAITVTDSLVDASSIIFGTIRTADATCTAITSIVPGAGSFVITLNAGCTAETSVGFLVTN